MAILKHSIIIFTLPYFLFLASPAFAICQTGMAYDPAKHACVCPKDLVNNRSLTNNLIHIGSCYSPMELLVIQDLVLWLDADDLATITWDEATLEVESWLDKTTNNNDATDLTPLTETDRPFIRFAGKNGRHTLSFVADSFLDGTITQIFGDANFTIIVVKQQTDTATLDRTAFSIGDNGDNINVGSTPAGPVNLRSIQFSGEVAFSPSDEEWHVHTTIRDFSNLRLFIDGTEMATDNRGALNLTNDYTIGRSVETADQDFFRGDIGEILVFDSAIDNTTRTEVERYLSEKWGIIVN